MEHLYTHVRVMRMGVKAKTVITGLFETYMEEPRQMPAHIHAAIQEPTQAPRVIADYVAGMTDRYAINAAREWLDFDADALPRGIDSPG